MKTLKQHNDERYLEYVNSNSIDPVSNGIACPICNRELLDSSPMTILTSNPPKKNIHCECGFTGYRLA